LSRSKKYVRTITRIPDELWYEIKNILPDEKPDNTIGRPIVPYRKVLDGILFVLRTGCQWKMLPKQRIWFWFNVPQKISGMETIRII
jgi:transposase